LCISGHAQVVEDEADVALESAEGGGDAVPGRGADDADREAAQARGVFGPVAGADAAAVLVPVPVKDIMAAVLNGPMVAIEGEDALGVGGVGAVAGDAVGELGGDFAALFVDDMTLDEESLADEREIEVVVERGRGPDRAGLKPAMSQRRRFAEVGLAALLEGELEVGEQRWLIGFDREQVMGLAILDDMGGELALGQQGIGGEGFACDVERLE
jgi:hypothetical protein